MIKYCLNVQAPERVARDQGDPADPLFFALAVRVHLSMNR
jgi:hypothetical protein